MSKALSKMPRAEQWAAQICAQLGKSVESIVETGRLLIKAKEDMPYGEWCRMFNENLVPFGIRSAQRLMRVAEHPLLSDATHGSHLPPSWRTLYSVGAR